MKTNWINKIKVQSLVNKLKAAQLLSVNKDFTSTITWTIEENPFTLRILWHDNLADLTDTQWLIATFNEEGLSNAEVKGNVISLKDVDGEPSEIHLFNVTPMEIES